MKWGPAKSVDHLIEFQKVAYDEPKNDSFDKDIVHPPTEEEKKRGQPLFSCASRLQFPAALVFRARR